MGNHWPKQRERIHRKKQKTHESEGGLREQKTQQAQRGSGEWMGGGEQRDAAMKIHTQSHAPKARASQL